VYHLKRHGNFPTSIEQLVAKGVDAHGTPIWMDNPNPIRPRVERTFDFHSKAILIPSEYRRLQKERAHSGALATMSAIRRWGTPEQRALLRQGSRVFSQ